jgi:hypothetical protein
MDFTLIFASCSQQWPSSKAKIGKRLAPGKSKLSNPDKVPSPCRAYVFSGKEMQ